MEAALQKRGLELKEIIIDQNNMHAFFIDPAHRRWGIMRAYEPIRYSIYHYSDLIDYEVYEDSGASIIQTKHGTGRAALGGILFGGAGAIVGAQTANQTIINQISNITVRITVQSSDPYISLVMFDRSVSNSGYKTLDNINNSLNREIYRQRIEQTRKLVSWFEFIKQGDRNKRISRQFSDERYISDSRNGNYSNLERRTSRF